MDENLFWSAGHCGLENEKEEREGVERGAGVLSRLLGAAVNSSFVQGCLHRLSSGLLLPEIRGTEPGARTASSSNLSPSHSVKSFIMFHLFIMGETRG